MKPYSLADIRRAFQGLVFFDTGHRYKWDGEQMASTTSVISKFKQPFDADYWSAYKAAQALSMEPVPLDKERGEIGLQRGTMCVSVAELKADPEVKAKIKEIRSEWGFKRQASAEYGTRVHEWGQHYVQGRIAEGAHPGLHKWWRSNGLQPVACEVVVGSQTYKIAGQVDLLAFDYENGEHILIDYKTNEKIEKTNAYQSMKEPFGRMPDCNWSHYTLQMNIYAEMLKRKGFPVQRLVLLHLPKLDDSLYEPMEVPLKPDLALAAFQAHKKAQANRVDPGNP